MKIRILVFTLLMSLLLSFSQTYSCIAEQLPMNAKSVILMEAETGKVLYEENADEQLPPASVTKIMTLLLVMEAVDAGKIKLSDSVRVSDYAAGMGGSQVYLKAGEEMSVEDLLKSVVIASANDAAAALAEYCAGSESAFVAQMNARAKDLGMQNTNFENTNGLDDTTTTHLTTARDIAIMSRELLRHEKILNYTTIWMDTIRNGEFGLTNTNRLIRYYKGATGLKTGSTSKAGFCISATAKREDMHLIAVVMGCDTRDARNNTAVKLLDYGFANYAFYKDDKQDLTQYRIPVVGSPTEDVGVYTDETFRQLTEKNNKEKIESTIQIKESLKAPVHKGDPVGVIRYTLNGKEIGTVPILAGEDAFCYSFANLFKLALKNLAIF